MSIFYELPLDLRERWWSANTLTEREAVETEFRDLKTAEVPVQYAPDYREALDMLDSSLWDPLKNGLIDQGDTVHEVLKSYVAACAETERLETEFYEHNEAWGTACVPNTDTKRVAEYWEGYGRLKNDIHYAKIHEQVMHDELVNLIQ